MKKSVTRVRTPANPDGRGGWRQLPEAGGTSQPEPPPANNHRAPKVDRACDTLDEKS
jgi:hypothetical protein